MPGDKDGGLGLLGTLGAIAEGVAFAMRTPRMARPGVEARILAHLAAHGRARGHELYMLFHEGNRLHHDGHAGPGAPGYVSLGAVITTLELLKDDGVVKSEVEEHGGRPRLYWSLDPWGGTRRRARRRPKGRASTSAMPGMAVALSGTR